VASGEYLLAVLEFSISGARPRTEVVPVFWNVHASEPLETDAGRQMFVRLLDEAESVESVPSLRSEDLEIEIGRLKNYLNRVRADMKARETTLQGARAARRRATQQATLDAKVRAAKLRLQGLESRQAAEFPVRMAKAKLQQEQNRLDAFLRESGEQASVSIEEREIAVALVSVVVGGVGGGALR
jgi:hypothetical protein